MRRGKFSKAPGDTYILGTLADVLHEDNIIMLVHQRNIEIVPSNAIVSERNPGQRTMSNMKEIWDALNECHCA